MINKVHVTEMYPCDLETVFNGVSDHAVFLSGDGITCQLLKKGKNDTNGDGAIRQIVSPKLTFEEEIFEFEKNQHFAYIITKITPKKPFKHIKGWLEFKQIGDSIRVDWYSHFEITVPIIGGIIGWFMKNALSKVFIERLKYLKSTI